MATYVCLDCAYEYVEAKEGCAFADLPATWTCPVCGAPKSSYERSLASETAEGGLDAGGPPDKSRDELEEWMADIREIAASGKSLDEAMRTRKPTLSWDGILFKGAQLARRPLLQEEPVDTVTVIGPRAAKPLVIASPIFVSHMSFGALSKEAKTALAKGSAMAQTAMCSGEGGILEESITNAHRYIFEYVPNRYSVTPENLARVHAIEIKIGQSAKPGMGGHLPGEKVTEDIAAARGFPVGKDILSPSRFPDINSPADLRGRIDELRALSGGVPIGVKIAAGRIEEDIDYILEAGNADFITVDGRPGGTGSAPKYIKLATSIPTIYALHRAREHLNRRGAEGISLIITGGLRISPDFAKALAMGADAVAIATSALIAIGCRQFRMCNTGRCPYGITSQDPELRATIDIEESARRLANFIRVSTEEVAQFARITGRHSVHDLSVDDLVTVDSEISGHTAIEHA
ncbi:MAG: rubredoxin [Planctomycetaceae bacterium]|nr:rubredoxin [Planctomycetaceae bacterium]